MRCKKWKFFASSLSAAGRRLVYPSSPVPSLENLQGVPGVLFLASRSCPCEQVTHVNPWTAPQALEEVPWEA